MGKVVCTFFICVTFLIAFCLWLAADRYEVVTAQAQGDFKVYQFDKWTGRSWYLRGEAKIPHPCKKESVKVRAAEEAVELQAPSEVQQ